MSSETEKLKEMDNLEEGLKMLVEHQVIVINKIFSGILGRIDPKPFDEAMVKEIFVEAFPEYADHVDKMADGLTDVLTHLWQSYRDFKAEEKRTLN